MAYEANRYPRRPDRDRDRSYTRQQEQFEDSSWRDDDRQQMGEVRDRDDDGQFGAGARERGYGRGSFETGPTSRQQEYSSGSYGPHYYGNREGRGFRSFTGSDFGGADFGGPQGLYGAAPRRDYGGYGERSERGFFERAGDEVASWFGDEDAARRREQDHRGHGPAGYTRSDERIREDANDKLTEDWRIDARAIEVSVASGEVTLDGTVPSREHKRRAEDLIDSLSGVKHVQNNLRVKQAGTWDRNNSGETSKS
jgi:osmotically-inducible protein OsmY